MRPPTLARQAPHPSAGDTGAPPAGGNLVVAVPHEGAVGLFIVPEETGLRMPDDSVIFLFLGRGSLDTHWWRGEAGVGDVERAVPLASGATPVALTVRSQA